MTSTGRPAVGRLERTADRARFVVDRFPDTIVRDPRGGFTTVRVALARVAHTQLQIDADESRGSRRHDRVSSARRWLVRLLPLLDGVVLLWFLTGVVNVDLRMFDPTLLVAVAFAALASLGIAAWSTAVGDVMRLFKDDNRALVWAAVDPLRRAMLMASLVVTLLLAGLMYARVADEVDQAGGGGPLAVVVGIVLAAVVALVNLYVLHTAFMDGSPATTELDRLGRALRSRLRRVERAADRAAATRVATEHRLAAERHLHGAGADR